jgi:hypothetical protein
VYIVASFVGFLAGLVSWFVGNYLIAQFIYWGGNRLPNPLSDRALKTCEFILCAIVFVLSVGILYFVARSLWPEH